MVRPVVAFALGEPSTLTTWLHRCRLLDALKRERVAPLQRRRSGIDGGSRHHRRPHQDHRGAVVHAHDARAVVELPGMGRVDSADGALTGTYCQQPAAMTEPTQGGKTLAVSALSLFAVGWPICNKLVVMTIGGQWSPACSTTPCGGIVKPSRVCAPLTPASGRRLLPASGAVADGLGKTTRSRGSCGLVLGPLQMISCGRRSADAPRSASPRSALWLPFMRRPGFWYLTLAYRSR